jgi:RNA polymerase sigma-70 factor (ECF subfamily)
MDQLDDRQCICAVLNGEVNAYSAIVKRYEKQIYNLMYRMTGSTADALDLSQEAFIKAYGQLHRFQQDRKFFPWLYTIAMNLAKNLLRSNKSGMQRACMDELEGCSNLDYPQQQEEAMCTRLDHKLLYGAMLRLPQDYREAIILRYQEGLSMEDIAGALQISLSGAKMRVHRGLGRLRDLLTDDQGASIMTCSWGESHERNG